MPDSDPIMERLEDQIAWYDSRSGSNQRWHRWLKTTEIIAAAAIPFVGTLPIPHQALITGGLGVLITVLEGLLHLYQYQQNWINYRCTSEGLKHEKFLYLAHAGPYATARDAHALLAERIESQIADEHTKWTSVQQQEEGGGKGGSASLAAAAKAN